MAASTSRRWFSLAPALTFWLHCVCHTRYLRMRGTPTGAQLRFVYDCPDFEQARGFRTFAMPWSEVCASTAADGCSVRFR